VGPSEVFCTSVLVKYLELFYSCALCECSSEVLYASVLVKCFVRVF
jgi:hypothetical protein